MEYAGVFIGAISILGTLILGFLTLRSDKKATESSTRSSDTEAAIDSLRFAFLTQQGLTHDCQNKCKELEAQNAVLEARIVELESK